MNNLQRYKAILWDLDGTLLNTIEDITDSTNFALREFGFPERTVQEVLSFVGNGILREMELAVPDGQSNPKFSEVYGVFRKHYAVNCGNKTRPYPEIPETIRTLKAQGFKQAIISNKNDYEAKLLAEQHFKDIFDSVFGESERVRKKPAPDAVFAALEVLGCRPEEALFIGDSDVDIRTAENAGVDCISASWGFRSKEFLLQSGANKIIDRPSEILQLLRSDDLNIRQAGIDDLADIMKIYRRARQFMADTGNPAQWGSTYPPEGLIKQDIADGVCYVCESSSRLTNQDSYTPQTGFSKSEIVGVFAFITGNDPTYSYIEDGNWLNDEPYGTIHRLAGSGSGRNIFSACLSWCSAKSPNLRCDTHADNKIMQHLLEKNGFQKCGRIYLANGSPRIAYQKSTGLAENHPAAAPDRS